MQKLNNLNITISYVITLLTAIYFPVKTLIIVYIVLGQSHFFLAYFYKIRESGFSKNYKRILITILSLLLLITLQSYPYIYIWLPAVLMFMFTLHVWYGDWCMLKSSGKTHQLLMFSLLPLMVSTSIPRGEYIVSIISYASLIILCFYLFYIKIYKKIKIDFVNYFYILSIVIILYCNFLKMQINQFTLIYFIIMYHGLKYYFHYLFKYAADKNTLKLKIYTRDVLLANIFFISLYFIYIEYDINYLKYLYELKYYLIAATLHIVFSYRFIK